MITQVSGSFSAAVPNIRDSTRTSPRLRVNRDSRHREGFKVSSGSSWRDLELRSHLGGSHPPTRLEEQQEGDQTVCTHTKDHLRQWCAPDEHFQF